MVESDPTPRSRTFSWADPKTIVTKGRELSGEEFFAAMLRGDIPPPPITATLGFELVSAGNGEAVFRCEPGEYHYNPIGVVHGGLAATLLDSATGCAVHSQLPRGTGYTTVNIKVDFMRPVTSEGGALLCEGKVVKNGRSIAIADGVLRNEAGTEFARASATFLIMPPKEGAMR